MLFGPTISLCLKRPILCIKENLCGLRVCKFWKEMKVFVLLKSECENRLNYTGELYLVILDIRVIGS